MLDMLRNRVGRDGPQTARGLQLWARLIQRLSAECLCIHRWRKTIRHINRLRRLQRLFAYAGHHLQQAAAGKYIRARLRVLFHTGSTAALRAAQKDLAKAVPLYEYG